MDNEELFIIHSYGDDALEFFRLSTMDDIERVANFMDLYVSRDEDRICVLEGPDSDDDIFIAGTRKYVLENQDRTDAKDTIKNLKLPHTEE